MVAVVVAVVAAAVAMMLSVLSQQSGTAGSSWLLDSPTEVGTAGNENRGV
jgi:hypothetical protein